MKGNLIQDIPAAVAPHTVESLYAEHGPQRAWTYWLLLAGVAGVLVILPLIDVEVSVRAAGVVRPTTERVELRPSIAGHISEVLVRDNERVAAGQPLLVLRARDVEERRARNLAVAAERSDMIADLKVVTTGTEIETPLIPSQSELEKGGASYSVGRRFPPVIQAISDPSFRTPVIRQEYAQFLAQLSSYQLADAKAVNELARYTMLAAKGIASRRELENAQYEVERLRAESQLLIAQTLARWQARMRDEQAALADLFSDAQRLDEEQTRYTLRSPASGVLVGFSGWSVGGFVAAGQTLGAVSPEDDLQVETYVSSRDIGLVRVGQRARLQIDAYPYTHWGTLDGTVTAISGDLMGGVGTYPTIGGAATPPNFKVLVRPAAEGLTLPNGVRGELKKGLTLSARFVVTRRSLFQLLYDDASVWLDPNRHS